MLNLEAWSLLIKSGIDIKVILDISSYTFNATVSKEDAGIKKYIKIIQGEFFLAFSNISRTRAEIPELEAKRDQIVTAMGQMKDVMAS